MASATTVVSVADSSIYRVTVSPGRAVPVIVGVEVLTEDVVVVNNGASLAPVSIVISNSVDAEEVFPAASVAVTVNSYVWSSEVSNRGEEVIENDPSDPAISVPITVPLVPPINSSTVLPAAAVPVIVGLLIVKAVVVVVIDGVLGAVVSISIVNPSDASDGFPAGSVALTVSV